MAKSPSLSVLIVDDDITLSLFLKESLAKDGHRVTVTVNEHGAREALTAGRPDLLLCDFILPGLDGSEIIRIAKQMYPGLFCVLISGHHAKLASHQIDGSPADLVIAKPVLKETLAHIIHQYRKRIPS